VNKKDNVQELSYITVTAPLLIALFALMMMSFGARAGNQCTYRTVCLLSSLIVSIASGVDLS